MSSALVDEFLRRTGRRECVRRALADSAHSGVALAILVLCVSIAAPSRTLLAAGVALACLALLVALRALRFRLDPADAELDGELRGGLRTWLDRRTQGGAMLAWLERELAARIRGLPPPRAPLPAWRRLRTARAALALLAVLLLLRLLWLPPLPDGVVEWAGRDAALGAEVERGADGEVEGRANPPPPADGREATEPRTEPPPSPGPDRPPPTPAPPSEALLGPPQGAPVEAPLRDAFVVPAFVDETAPQVAAPAAADPAVPTPPSPPPADDVDFERAAEAALRSRHVPADERPFVRRWFRSLVEKR